MPVGSCQRFREKGFMFEIQSARLISLFLLRLFLALSTRGRGHSLITTGRGRIGISKSRLFLNSQSQDKFDISILLTLQPEMCEGGRDDRTTTRN
ncbi:hypothetical protein GGS21DRAFT_493359 [Xylaria nigripes]|nr:hypothetical protein GGS21DRAFT_493359 [Xylaria nigripes]